MKYPKCSVQSPVFLTIIWFFLGWRLILSHFSSFFLWTDRPVGAPRSVVWPPMQRLSRCPGGFKNGWDHWNQQTVAVWPTNATLEAPWTEKSKRRILPSIEGMNQSPRYPSYIHLYGVFATASSATKHLEGVSDSQGAVPQNLNRNYSRMFRLGTWNTWNTWNGISCFNHLEMCLILWNLVISPWIPTGIRPWSCSSVAVHPEESSERDRNGTSRETSWISTSFFMIQWLFGYVNLAISHILMEILMVCFKVPTGSQRGPYGVPKSKVGAWTDFRLSFSCSIWHRSAAWSKSGDDTFDTFTLDRARLLCSLQKIHGFHPPICSIGLPIVFFLFPGSPFFDHRATYWLCPTINPAKIT